MSYKLAWKHVAASSLAGASVPHVYPHDFVREMANAAVDPAAFREPQQQLEKQIYSAPANASSSGSRKQSQL